MHTRGIHRLVLAFTAIALFGASLVALRTLTDTVSAEQAVAATTNPVTVENGKAGTTAWRIGQNGNRVADDANGQIKGYASATSVNKGGSITFKVSVNPGDQQYTIAIYRIGCYPNSAGTCLGGRFMTELGPYDGVRQPACPMDPVTGLLQCDWTGPSFTVPTTWTSGVFVAVLTSDAGYQNYIPFVVRDDARQAALLYQQPVTNYQAYNPYPWLGDGNPNNGKSLYDNKSGGADTIAGAGRPRAVKVSFDRPYAGDGAGELLDENGWSWEGYQIRWMEENGYDVAYSTSLDTHEHPERMRNYTGWVSVGHDEYWSKEMFDGAEAARDARVNLAFFGGNDVYWQIRFEPSAGGQADRTMVAYKNSPNNSYSTMDPIEDPALKTVRFQDPPVNRPPQELLGQSFLGSTGRSTLNTPYHVQDAEVVNTSHWVYGGSGFTNGAEVPGIVGYETDEYSCHYPLPANQSYTILARSPFRDSDGYTADAHASIYQAPSGAWVFDAGTMSWSWALDRQGYVDPRVQATTKNILDAFAGITTPTPPSSSHIPSCSDHRNLTFEDGSLTSVPGPGATGGDKVLGTVVRETTNPISGTTSMKIPNVLNSYLDTRLTPTDDTDVTLKVRVNALPSADVRMVMLTSLINVTGNLVLRPTGLICLRNANAWVGGNPTNSCTSQPVTLGQTYKLRIRQVRGTGQDGVLEAFVAQGSAAFGAPFLRTTTGTWTTKVDRVAVGTTSGAVLDAVFDDIAIDGVPLVQPSAPSGLTATASVAASQVSLSWSDNATNESSYVVQRDTDSSFGSPTSFKLAADATSYTDTSAADDSHYWYRVRAVNAASPSDPSNLAEVTTRPAPPAAPTGLSATSVSVSQTALSWTDNAGNETEYDLQRADNPSFDNATTITLAPDTTTYDDSGLSEGVYYYRVRASNGISSSAFTGAARGPRIKDVTFEDGTANLVNSATGVSANSGGVQETAAAIFGDYSARIPGLSNAYLTQSVSGTDDLYASLYLRLNAMPTVDNRIIQVMNGNTTLGNLWIRANGTLCVKYGNSWSGGSAGTACTPTSTPLRAGTTYRIAFRHRSGDGSSNAILQASWATHDPVLGTGPLVQFTSTSLAPAAAGYWTAPPTALRVGATLSGTPLDAVLDDIKLDSRYMPGPSQP